MATKKAVKKVAKKAVKKAPARKAVGHASGRKNKPGEGLRKDSSLGKTLAERTEENMRPSTKRRRDVFVAEYLYDFNGAAAYRRMRAICDPDNKKELTPAQASNLGYNMRNEPYVELRIREVVDLLEQKELINQNRILAMLVREANVHGIGAQHGGRVAALKTLVDVLGMGSAAQQARRAAAGSGRGSGVMVVPEEGSVGTWEERAQAAQAKLKEEVRK